MSNSKFSRLINLTGQKFGRLEAIKRSNNLGKHRVSTAWECICRCGAKRVVRAYCLRAGVTKSCGCIRREILIKRNFRHGKYFTREHRIFRDAKHRAQSIGLPFNITVEDIHIPKVCPVLGIPIVKNSSRPVHGSPSLDRFDNSRGYLKGNIKIISQRANTLKSNATLGELKAVILYMEGGL